MSSSSTNMGLTRWNDPNDTFSYTELFGNWDLIDNHDHSPSKGVQIPTEGIANSAVTAAKLGTDSVVAGKIPIATIAGDRLVNSTVPDTKIASPNNAIWRTLSSQAAFTASMASGTVYGLVANGSLVASGVSAAQQMFIFPWTASHYVVASKSTKMRVLGVVTSNATSPGAANLTLALAPISSNAGTPGLSVTLGGAVAGSGSTIAAPAASNRSSFVGAEFSAPADGYYALTVSASALVNAPLGFNALIQIRHV